MNRRELMRRGPLALLGIVGIAAGIKVTPEPKKLLDDTHVTFELNDRYMKSVLEVVTRDYRANGRMREIQRPDL